MKHIVLFKFEDQKKLPEISELVKSVYEELKNEFNVINGYDFKLNCVSKDVNMDLVLFVDLDDELSLPKYIEHPAHKEFLNKLGTYNIISKAVIDIQ